MANDLKNELNNSFTPIEYDYRAVIGLDVKYYESHGMVCYTISADPAVKDDLDSELPKTHDEWYVIIGRQLFRGLWSICSWFDSWMLYKREK